MDISEDSDLNSDSNSTSNYDLPLKISFIILLLIAIFGLSYIFIFSKTSNKKITTKIVPTLIPTIAPIEKTSLTPQYEYQGKIVELNLTTITPVSGSKIEFSFKIEIDDKGTKKPHIFFFDKNELNNMKITNQLGKNISYNDFKIGQSIKIIRINDFDTEFYQGFKIVVLN